MHAQGRDWGLGLVESGWNWEGTSKGILAGGGGLRRPPPPPAPPAQPQAPRSSSTASGLDTGPWASWQAAPPHLLGDLGHIQLVLELHRQPREAPGTGRGLPAADGVPVAPQGWELPPGHGEDAAQRPGAWCARELLQEGGGHQQLLGARAGRRLGRVPNQGDPGPGPRPSQTSLPHALCQAWGGVDAHHYPASPS